MTDATDIRCDPDDAAGLLAEIRRRDIIITALMNQVQRDLNSPTNNFSLLQTTFVLEEEVKHRTGELEHARDALAEAKHDAEAARQHLAAAIGSISEGFVVFDAEDKLVLCNDAYRQIWGFEGDTTGRAFIDLLTEAAGRNKATSPAWFNKRVQSHRTGTGTEEYRLENGQVLQIRERKTPDGGTVGLYADITELSEVQAQALHNEKLASLGGLVVGVAHEINTPLGISLTAASHLEEHALAFRRIWDANLVKRSDLAGFMDLVDEATSALLTNLRRAADQVKSFKLVAVDQSSEARRKFNLREYLDEILLSLRPQLKRTRHCVEVDCPDAIVLDSYPGAFSQIFTNFVMNSLLHAFDEGGEGRMAISVRHEGATLILCYRDDGHGMAHDASRRIFEPFFTTKRGKGGSGLGMHIVYNLVTQRLGGTIECRTAPGEGMKITIRLPLGGEGTDDGDAS